MFIFHFDMVGLLTLLTGVILPLLVGLVTAKEQSPALKSVLLLVLSIAASVIGQIIQAIQSHTPFDIFTAALFVVATFLTGVGAHFGLWKPVGASAKLQAVKIGPRKAKPVSPALVDSANVLASTAQQLAIIANQIALAAASQPVQPPAVPVEQPIQ